jgi:hypothetical protein
VAERQLEVGGAGPGGERGAELEARADRHGGELVQVGGEHHSTAAASTTSIAIASGSRSVELANSVRQPTGLGEVSAKVAEGGLRKGEVENERHRASIAGSPCTTSIARAAAPASSGAMPDHRRR